MGLVASITALAQSVAADIKALLSGKVDKVTGFGLSSNDYTSAEKTKLGGIATGATANPDTGSLTEGTNLYFTVVRVLAGALDTLTLTNSAIIVGDSVRVMFGKLQAQITAREPSITGGTVSQFWAGTKAWVDFATTVRASVLTGYTVGANSAILATDTLLAGLGKVQGQISALVTSESGKEPAITSGAASQLWLGNKTWATIQTTVVNTLLTGYTLGANSVVLATDSLISALGKLQAQVSAALPLSGGTLTGAINEAASVPLASAATVAIGAASSNNITISGTVTITAFDTITAGAKRTLVFSGVMVLTYNATTMQLLTGASITTVVGDSAVMESLGGGNWKMLSYTRASGVALVNTTVGLVNFTDTLNAAAPNASLPIGVLAATGSATDVVVAPHGNGGFALQVADGTVTGGNKRGTKAVDLQMLRTAATQVASGNYSFVSGYNCTASGLYSIALGDAAAATGDYSIAIHGGVASGGSCLAIGGSAVASGTNSYAIGNNATASNWGFALGIMSTAINTSVALGYGSIATGNQSAAIASACSATGAYSVSAGNNSVASGNTSTALGGSSTTRGITGALAWASLAVAVGRTQTGEFNLRYDTVDATPVRLTTDGAVPSAINGPVLPNTSTYRCRISVTARNLTTGASASWSGIALIHREANAAATSFTGTPVLTNDFIDSGLSGCVVALNADTTLGALGVTVTGMASTSIRWNSYIETLETTN